MTKKQNAQLDVKEVKNLSALFPKSKTHPTSSPKAITSIHAFCFKFADKPAYEKAKVMLIEDLTALDDKEAKQRIIFNDAEEQIEINDTAIEIAYNFPKFRAQFHCANCTDFIEKYATPTFKQPFYKRRLQLSDAAIKTAHEFKYKTYDDAKFPAQGELTAEETRVLFKDNFILGENHKETHSKKFILERMDEFAKNGTTLYIEHFRKEQQVLIDRYLNSAEDQDIPPALLTFLRKTDGHWLQGEKNYNLEGILRAAKTAKVRIVGLADESAEISSPNWDIERALKFNQLTGEIISADKGHRKGNYLVLLGQKHAHTHKGGIPGVAQLLNLPAVAVQAGGSLSWTAEDVMHRRPGKVLQELAKIAPDLVCEYIKVRKLLNPELQESKELMMEIFRNANFMTFNPQANLEVQLYNNRSIMPANKSLLEYAIIEGMKNGQVVIKDHNKLLFAAVRHDLVSIVDYLLTQDRTLTKAEDETGLDIYARSLAAAASQVESLLLDKYKFPGDPLEIQEDKLYSTPTIIKKAIIYENYEADRAKIERAIDDLYAEKDFRPVMDALAASMLEHPARTTQHKPLRLVMAHGVSIQSLTPRGTIASKGGFEEESFVITSASNRSADAGGDGFSEFGFGVTEHEVLKSNLIHEMTHAAAFLVFKNKGRPYFLPEDDKGVSKKQYRAALHSMMLMDFPVFTKAGMELEYIFTTRLQGYKAMDANYRELFGEEGPHEDQEGIVAIPHALAWLGHVKDHPMAAPYPKRRAPALYAYWQQVFNAQCTAYVVAANKPREELSLTLLSKEIFRTQMDLTEIKVAIIRQIYIKDFLVAAEQAYAKTVEVIDEDKVQARMNYMFTSLEGLGGSIPALIHKNFYGVSTTDACKFNEEDAVKVFDAIFSVVFKRNAIFPIFKGGPLGREIGLFEDKIGKCSSIPKRFNATDVTDLLEDKNFNQVALREKVKVGMEKMAARRREQQPPYTTKELLQQLGMNAEISTALQPLQSSIDTWLQGVQKRMEWASQRFANALVQCKALLEADLRNSTSSTKERYETEISTLEALKDDPLLVLMERNIVQSIYSNLDTHLKDAKDFEINLAKILRPLICNSENPLRDRIPEFAEGFISGYSKNLLRQDGLATTLASPRQRLMSPSVYMQRQDGQRRVSSADVRPAQVGSSSVPPSPTK